MYRKEIIYIGLYKNENRIGSAGFLKVESRERDSRLYLKTQNIPLGISGRFPVRVYNGSDWTEINGLAIRDGGGIWEESLDGNVSGPIIQVMLSGGYMLEGKSKSAPNAIAQKSAPEPRAVEEMHQDAGVQEQETVKADIVRGTTRSDKTDDAIREDTVQDTAQPQKKVIITEELKCSPSEGTTESQSLPNYNLKEDKWEQLLDTYEKIHPYGDERVYVKLEPKDFVILQSKYQHLVNNSFLLHGFYNYRYIILGKEKDYYLGVPGVFYEREKMVAQMFGFEAFECPGGNVRAGEFGYYLRKVEI